MKLKALAASACLMFASTSASALNIALTNDDGWSTPGIQALFDALTEAGHTVVLAAPLDGQSGSSAAFNIDSLEVTRQAENQYSVALEGGETGAEPATAGAFATKILTELTGEMPDLLISGINDGANTAAATVTSGTVGAAIHSVALVLGESVPAIAISTDERCDEDAGITEACREVADFVVDYVDHLTMRPNFVKGNSKLIQRELALNINFPPGEPQGVVIAQQGRLPLLAGSFRSIDYGCPEGCSALEVGETTGAGILGAPSVDPKGDVADSDAILFDEGFITVVIIEANYSAKAGGLTKYLNRFDF
ncbi:MAG: 5'/3'-nucleotidase SurE [Pseudomonadota bacterium]